jgi:hypothetical protein
MVGIQEDSILFMCPQSRVPEVNTAYLNLWFCAMFRQYACRKTLADSRPRVRGRFAKNMDDDIPVAVLGRKREDDDDEEVCRYG